MSILNINIVAHKLVIDHRHLYYFKYLPNRTQPNKSPILRSFIHQFNKLQGLAFAYIEYRKWFIGNCNNCYYQIGKAVW